jgi:hypothetical protein
MVDTTRRTLVYSDMAFLLMNGVAFLPSSVFLLPSSGRFASNTIQGLMEEKA